MSRKPFYVAFLVSLLYPAPPAFAWGPYLHQQIYLTASALLARQTAGPWLTQNRRPGMRYSMSPDIDWQNFGAPPADPLLAALRNKAAAHEGPTHFYDVDGFARSLDPMSLDRAVPRSADYRVAAAEMAERSRLNRAHLASAGITPTKPSESERWGSAPWRAQQLYDLSVEALGRGQPQLALMRLSALGHYISDLAVPFHTSVNYDGQDRGERAKGVHLAFEMKMPEAFAALAGSHPDKRTGLWNDFRSSEAAVSGTLVDVELPELPREEIVDTLVDLAIDSFRLRARIADAFIFAVDQAEAEGADEAGLMKIFGEKTVVVDGEAMSVRELAMRRVALSSWLVARAWNSAFARASATYPGFSIPTARVGFDPAFLLKNYPAPEYLSRRTPLPMADCGRALLKVADSSAL